MEFIKKLLLEAFEGSDQGVLTSFCGVKIDVKDSGVSLSMSYYWDKVLKKFGIKPTDVESSPIIAKINRADCPEKPDPKLKTSFLGIVGSIMFGFTHCRLDLAYACGCLTRVMHAPSSEHYKQAEHLLRYINATKNWRVTTGETQIYNIFRISPSTDSSTQLMQTAKARADLQADGSFSSDQDKARFLPNPACQMTLR